MEINDIIRLMQAVTENGLTSFELEEGDLKLSLKKEKEVVTLSGVPVAAEMGIGSYTSQKNEISVAFHETDKVLPGDEISSGKVVSSPLVGTFYNAASPESEPFVKVGDSVKKGQTLGIIEAMKLMNEIDCEFDGVVEAILVSNEDVVEYGQPLFRIR